jgi:predicted secreted hydrolase
MITTKLKPSSLQLDDRTELMVYRLRHADGGVDPRSSGTWGHSDGQAEHLPWEMFEVVAQGQWTRACLQTLFISLY